MNNEIEIHFRNTDGKLEPLFFDSSEEALISILEHLKTKDVISFMSVTARVCVDVERNEFYFCEV